MALCPCLSLLISLFQDWALRLREASVIVLPWVDRTGHRLISQLQGLVVYI